MTEKIKIQNSKGQNLSAVVHFPKDPAGKLIILCPGYLDSKDYLHFIKLSEHLEKLGYTVVRFDPNGTWESEGDISEYLTSQYLKDIKSILEYMLKKSEYKFVVLAGHSRGGMVSILYAARDPRISAVIGIMPSSSFSLKGKRREEWEKNGFKISYREHPENTSEKVEFKIPYSHILDRDQFNLLEEVKNVHAPLILMSGELDVTVFPEDVKKIYEKANEPKKYIVINGIGHDYRKDMREIEKVNDIIVDELLALETRLI